MLKVYPWFKDNFDNLAAAYNAERLPHAILVASARGTGKLNFALDLAKSILCETSNNQLQLGCGRCKACLLFDANTHPDFYLVDKLVDNKGKQKQSIGIDQIRLVTKKLADTAQFSGWRVAIIASVSAMTTASFNALLKTLEEPGENTLLILLADNPHKIAATIRSRCQIVQPSLQPEALKQWLQQQTSQLPQQIDVALQHCFNAPLGAKEYLESNAGQQTQKFYELCDQLLLNQISPQQLLQQTELDHLQIIELLASYFYNVAAAKLTGKGLDEYARLPAKLAFQLYSKILEFNRAQAAGSNLSVALQLQPILLQWLNEGRKITLNSDR